MTIFFQLTTQQQQLYDLRLKAVVVELIEVEGIWLFAVGECAPLHCDRFCDQLGAVQLHVTELFGYVLTDGLANQVGHEVGHNLAICGWLQVTHLLRLYHG